MIANKKKIEAKVKVWYGSAQKWGNFITKLLKLKLIFRKRLETIFGIKIINLSMAVRHLQFSARGGLLTSLISIQFNFGVVFCDHLVLA